MHTWLATVTESEPAQFLLDHVADAVIAVDTELRITYWSKGAAAMYGWQADQVLGMPSQQVLEVVRYVDGSDSRQVIAQAYQQGVWRGEVVQRHRDGRDLIIEAAIHLLRNPAGEVIGMVGLNRDVTARHALEAERRTALAEAERAQQRLALLAEASLALAQPVEVDEALDTLARIIAADLADWCIVDVCDAAGALQRVAVAAARPGQEQTLAAVRSAPPWPSPGCRGATRVAVPSDAPEPYAELLQTLGATSALVAPLRAGERALGRLILVRAGASRPFSAADQTLAEELAHRAALTITASRLHRTVHEHASQAEESRALVESLLRAAPVGFAFFDRELRFQVINERFASCNGKTVAEHLGCTVDEVVPQIADVLGGLVRQVLATGEPIVELPLSGEGLGEPWEGKHWLETFYPVFTPAGHMLGVGLVSVEVTELRRLGLDLARSRMQLAGIIDSAMDAIITVDERQQVVLFNQAAERLFRVGAADVIGTSLDRFIPPEHREAHRAHVEAFGSTGAPAGHRADTLAPLTALRADGAIFPVETSISKLATEGATLYTVILRDISARLAAEQQLRASEANLRAVFDNSAQSFVLLDGEHRLVLWNRLANERSLAVTGRQLVAGASIVEYTAPGLVSPLRNSLARAARGEPVHVERSLGTPERPLWLAFDYIPVRDAAGAVIGTCMSTLDITAQRIALEAITRSEERFRALVAGTSDLIVLLGHDLTLRYASPAWERLLGWELPLWEGRDPFGLVHPEDRPAAEEAITQLLSGSPEPSQLALRLQHARGGWVWVEVVGADLRTHPAVQGVLLTIRDITERKRLTAQLLQAQKMESIGRLAGGVAHDFNNLLTAITGYLELALEGLPADSPARADILEAQRSAGRASGLTRQLLAFARKQEIAPQSCALNDLIADMDRLLRRLIGENITLVTALAPDLGLVTADPGQIEQVIVNLAVNARDAMPHGGTLTIETANVTADETLVRRLPALGPGDYVRISVTDTGVGIDEAVREHIFEPFFTTKGLAHGTGLGLATCYGIVSQHGGEIEVVSQPDAGAAFLVYLPLSNAASPRAPARFTPAAAPAAGSETVLVVEDELAVRTLAARVLRESGYTVLAAADGDEALRVLAAERDVRLVLTDVVMPRLGGGELAARLNVTHPRLPVICMSGYTSEAGVEAAARDLRVRLIHKPFTPAALLQLVREALDAAQAAAAPQGCDTL